MKNEKEFTFSFSHYAFRSAAVQWDKEKKDWIKPIRVGIMLLAEREGEDPARKESITVATSSFLPGQKPDQVLMTVMDVDNKVISQLFKQGWGKEVKREGKEEVPWIRIDVTDFYNRYMKEHEQIAMKSPISHVFQCQVQKINGKDPEDFMKCRIGGIEQKPQWSGITGREFFKVAALYPDSRFQLKELAQEAFQKQLETYRQAKVRVTDASIRFSNGMHFIRCKIDGEWQLSKEFSRLDYCDYIINKDIHALASKYYEKELDAGMKRSQGRSL